MPGKNEISMDLAKKYGERTHMYTEYPNIRYWEESVSDVSLRSALKTRFKEKEKIPFLLYVHIPHCHTQCYFCTCHVIITLKYTDVVYYLSLLYKEIELLHRFFEANSIIPHFTDVHIGGGSPTYLKEKDFDIFLEKLSAIVDFRRLEEFAIEIDPRRVKEDKIRYYHSKGINRVSFGVQDFDLKVQEAVNRIQPDQLIERLMSPELRKLFPKGINFDIINGLPEQTVESMTRTMEKLVSFSPERICLNYLHFVPEPFPHQLLMKNVPDNYQRKILFRTALDILTKNGYIRTGYDHFVKPTDAVAYAMNKGDMKWNRLGVTAGRYVDTLGIGVHGVSMLSGGDSWYFQDSYAQQKIDPITKKVTYSLEKYKHALEGGHFPIFREHKLNRDDLIRRDVIHCLRNYFALDFVRIEKEYGIIFSDYFSQELDILSKYEQDGIIKISSDSLLITEEFGHEFADSVCGCFDIYRRKNNPAT